MEDKWKQSFKSALSDYEGEDVDLSWDEVWDAYDSTRKKRILPVALYWAAAAAAAVAVVVMLSPGRSGSQELGFEDAAPFTADRIIEDYLPQRTDEELVEPEALSDVLSGGNLLADASISVDDGAAYMAEAMRQRSGGLSDGITPVSGGTGAETEPGLLAVQNADIMETEDSQEVEDTEVQPVKEKDEPAADGGIARAERGYWAKVSAMDEIAGRRKVSISAGAFGGSMLGSASSVSGNPFPEHVNLKGVYYDGMMMSPEGYPVYGVEDSGEPETKASSSGALSSYSERHDFPVKAGASVRFGLDDRLGVSTGLVFTRLRSVFTGSDGAVTAENTQTLGYLGIPLSLDYSLFSRQGLRVYASAGGRAEMMVYGNMDSKAFSAASGQEVPFPQGDGAISPYPKPSKGSVQLSLNGSLGIEYMFTKRFGAYLEPGFSWYIPNTSHNVPKSYYTKHPFSFDITWGVRFNFGK